MIPKLGVYGIKDQGSYSRPRWTHDHSIALIIDKKVQWVLELERYTKVKHDNRLDLFIEGIIQEKIIELPEKFQVISVDSFVGSSFISKNGLWRIESSQQSFPKGVPFLPSRCSIGIDPLNKSISHSCTQELAHIASNLPFTRYFKEHSLLIHLDGGASQSSASAFIFENNTIKHLHHSWDNVWAAMNFGWNDLINEVLQIDSDDKLSCSGKLMAFASYGKDIPEIRIWLKKNDWFRNHSLNPDLFFQEAYKTFGWNGSLDNQFDGFLQNIAASSQYEIEEISLDFLKKMQLKTKSKVLYAGGGVFMNINLNRKILDSGLFDEIYIPPCTSDSGLALGAAALSEFLENGTLEKHTPFLNNFSVSNSINSIKEELIDELLQRIMNGQIIGIFSGAAEVGPRALGHRSLIAIPTSVKVKIRLSEKMKAREWYRPLAPIILQEVAEDVFPNSTVGSLAKYMLSSYVVSEKWRNKLPGVLHIDNTARVQIVEKDDDQLIILRRLLEKLWSIYKVPCLINTSFNCRNEPIVHTILDAKRSAQILGVDALLINNHIESFRPINLNLI